MVSKKIFSILLTSAALSFAQQAPQQPAPPPPPASDPSFFNQAPPGVEDGLRARLKIFYDCYLTGKFRPAYELVAEEDKDDYFNRAKTPYHSYRITTIQFSDNYTVAKVVLVINRDFHFQGRIMAVDVPISEHWKIENGQWVWYLPNKGIRSTPFGGIAVPDPSLNAASGTPAAGKPLSGMLSDPESQAAAFDSLAWPDKPVLSLGPSDQFQDHAVLTNHSANALAFHLEFKPLTGLKVEPATGVIEAGHSMTLRARYDSPDHGLPADRSPRPIKVVYEGRGTVQVGLVWEADAVAKTTGAKN
ncbi:MAG: hypothetical protein WA324_04935 [Bryobacteraceae bacterium]